MERNGKEGRNEWERRLAGRFEEQQNVTQGLRTEGWLRVCGVETDGR